MNSPDAAVIAIPFMIAGYQEHKKQKLIAQGEAIQGALDLTEKLKKMNGETDLATIVIRAAMEQGKRDFPDSFNEGTDTLLSLLNKAQAKWDKGHSNKLKGLFYDGPNPAIYRGMIKAIKDPLLMMYVDYRRSMMQELPYFLSRRGEGAWYIYVADKTHEEVEDFFINQIKTYDVRGRHVPRTESKLGNELYVKYLGQFRYWHSDFKRMYLGLMRKAHAKW